MRFLYYLPIIALLTFQFAESQPYLELLRDGETSLEKIEQAANRYFKKVGTDNNDYKFYQRWLYGAKMEADEQNILTPNSVYLEELHRYNKSRNISTRSGVVQQTAAWNDLGPTYKNGTSGWNPGVGRITSLAFENTTHFIAGSPTGGIWKTTDGGQNWSCLTDNMSNIDVYSLALAPNNSNTYFWGSTEGRIFKSTDGGASWTLLNGSSSMGSSTYDRVNKILIKPENTDIMYASVENEGVFRSTNGGVSWSKIHSESNNGYDIEFKPGNTNEVYATGNNFYKSTDNGVSFSPLSKPDLSIGGVNWTQEMIKGDHEWVYANTNQNNTVSPKTGNGLGLYFSGTFENYSARLISKQIDLSAVANPSLSFSYTNANYGGDVEELTVSYRTNTSQSWTTLSSYTTEAASWTDVLLDLSTVTNNSSTFQIAFTALSNWGRGLTLDDITLKDASDNILFFEGFEAKNSLLNGAFSGDAKMMGVSAQDPSKIYILEEKNSIFNGLYISNDNGQTFSKLDHTDKNYFGYSSQADDNRGQAPRDMDITVDPNNADIVYMAGILSWRSTDGGENFSISSQWVPGNAVNENIGYCHADIDIIEYVNGNLFVGSDGGVYKAADPNTISANYYEDLSTGIGVRQFYKIGVYGGASEIVSGGSQDNGTSVLVGGVWKDWLGADGMETFVDKDDSNTLYGTSQYGSLYYSSNQGDTAFGLTSPAGKAGSDNGANWVVPFEQDPLISDKLYVAYDVVYAQALGLGLGWNAISQQFDSNIDHFKIAPNNSDIMYLAVNNLFYKTTDGGLTDWTAVTLPENTGSINAITINKDNPNMLALAVSGSNKVLLSSDGGSNWQIINNSLPSFSANALCFYGEDLILGMNYGVFYNDADDRNTWVAFSDNLPNVRIYELEVNYNTNKVYAATYGRGLWAASLDPSALSVDDKILAQILVYPNPADDHVVLKIPQSIDASLKIYNTSGQIVYYAKKQTLEQNHRIPISYLSKGNYVLRITTDHHTTTFKVMKN